MEGKGNKSRLGKGKDSAISQRFHPDQIGGLTSGNNRTGAGGCEAGVHALLGEVLVHEAETLLLI
jgi:hypothetical protein